MIRKIFSHSLIYAVGPQLPRVASLFILPVITRYLTAFDYGVYGIVTSYVGILIVLNDLGFGVVLTNSFFKHPGKWPVIWRQLHFYLLLWAVVFSLLVAVLILFTIPAGAVENAWPLIFIHTVTYIFFNPAVIIGTKYYQLAQKPLFIMYTSAISGIVTVSLTLYTIAWLKMGYMGWFVSIFAGSLVQFLFFIYPVYFKYKLHPLFRFRKRFLTKQLKISLPVVPHSYASFLLNSSDRIVMDRQNIGTPEIGKYNMAYTVGSYFDFFGNAVALAVNPVYITLFSKQTKQADDAVFYITRWMQFGFLLLGFCLSLWAREIFDILISNNTLVEVYPIAIFIIMGYVYRPYYWATVNRLQFNEQTTQLWKISLIAGLANLVLNIILVPVFGITVAAITTFFCFLYMGFAGYYLDAFKKTNSRNYYPLPMAGLIILATVVVYFLKDIPVPVKTITTLGAVLLFALYTGSERNRLKIAD